MTDAKFFGGRMPLLTPTKKMAHWTWSFLHPYWLPRDRHLFN